MTNWDDAWYLEVTNNSLAEACQRVTEPDLATGLVVQCREFSFEKEARYDVRLGPTKDRTQLDAVRQRYLDKGISSMIVRKEVCIKPVHIDCSAATR